MSLIQLDPPLVLYTPKGKAIAHFLIDYGFEMDLHWICFQNDTGQCWTWNNKDIRIDNNSTAGRDVKPIVQHKNGNGADTADVMNGCGSSDARNIRQKSIV